MKTKTKVIIILTIVLLIVIGVLIIVLRSGVMQNKFDEVQGDLVGHAFNIEAYDSYGEETLSVSGKSVSISGNRQGEDLTSVITITIDGKEIQSCGDTLIFAEKGLVKELDFTSQIEDQGRAIPSLSYKINQYANKFGKSRIVIIKSQEGQPLMAYSGDKVYWEIVNDLPKTTKLMIDGKALYIHRANFQIIDKKLIS
ncbi:MAG: DUF5052 family protein [Mogibacterium sp.]|nr:DUF5052 family protein [Mogibacterium sp.]